MIQHDVMIVEGFRSPKLVVNNQQLTFDDKLRILEKWNQMLAIKIQVFPEHEVEFNKLRKDVIALINALAKENIELHDLELI